jgi:hypothetical protein
VPPGHRVGPGLICLFHGRVCGASCTVGVKPDPGAVPHPAHRAGVRSTLDATVAEAHHAIYGKATPRSLRPYAARSTVASGQRPSSNDLNGDEERCRATIGCRLQVPS